jgi:uncharacterized sulfatase
MNKFLLKNIVLVSLIGTISMAQNIATPAPNVLLIIVDDLNTSLGCYGNKEVFSPNIDRLAAKGVRFDRAYCQYPLCNPSRASFLSGKRPETTGIYVLNIPARTALPNAEMLPQYFRNRGYFTAGAGKVFHNTKMSDAASWDFYEDNPSQDAEEKSAVDTRQGGGDGKPSSLALSSDGSKTRDGVNTQTILKLLREKTNEKKPFFLAAGFHKPHLPWTAPKRFFDLYSKEKITIPSEPKMRDVPKVALQTELSGFSQPVRKEAIQGYYACISFTDSQIGLLLDEMDKLSLWENTIVVLVGDNGFHLGDHDGLWAKLSQFDASTHVPMIMAGAGIPKGKVLSSPVEILDIYPTLVALSGGGFKPELEGKSLLPFFSGKKQITIPAKSMVFHYDSTMNVDILGRTVIDKKWRYTEWDNGQKGKELYIHASDPKEYINQINIPSSIGFVKKGQNTLKNSKSPKPGEANRPRALLKPGMKSN